MCACLQVYKGHMYVKISVTPLSWGSCRTQNSPILISLTRWLVDLSQQLAPGIPHLFLSSARIQACCTCWEFRFWRSRLWSWCLSTKPSQPQPDSILLGSLRFLLVCSVGILLRPSHILGKCSTSKVHLQPIFRVTCLFLSSPHPFALFIRNKF